MHHARRILSWLAALLDRRSTRVHSGQAIIIVAGGMVGLLAVAGLSVDVGLWLAGKSRLQRAVDAAALSVVLDRPLDAQTGDSTAPATVAVQKLLVSQGLSATELRNVTTDVPRANQLMVEAELVVPTAFVRVIGIEDAVVHASATADINTYAEIPVSPLCGGVVGSGANAAGVVCDGGIGDSTMDQFGINRAHGNGDAYTNPTSPFYRDSAGQVQLPEGYLYRVAVDAGYTGEMAIQVWDPDGFNRHNPPRWQDPTCTDLTLGCLETELWTKLNDKRTSGGSDFPSIARNYYANGYHLFWRVDECNSGSATCRTTSAMTPIQFTLWHLDPDALDPLNPQPGERQNIQRVLFRPSGTSHACEGGVPCTIREYNCSSDSTNGNVSGSHCTDLRWLELFRVNVSDYPARTDGTRSFFIYVKAIGSTDSENVYHLRSGPPPGDPAQAACQANGQWSAGRAGWEDVNNQVNCQWSNGRGSSNTKIYARRAMPVNVMQAADGSVPYVVWLAYVPKSAAGQTLRVREYDLDRPTSSCSPLTASNRIRFTAFFPSDGRRVDVLDGCGSANAEWREHSYTVPTDANAAFWGTDEGFWLYANVFQKVQSNPFWDTAVFEVLFDRARLVR